MINKNNNFDIVNNMELCNFKKIVTNNKNCLSQIIHKCFECDRIDFLVYLDEDRDFLFEMDSYKDKNQNDCLLIAAFFGGMKCVKYLIEDLDWDKDVRNNDSLHFLHLSSYKGNLNIIKYFIEKFKIDPINIITLVDKYDVTPYMYACMSGNLELVKYFDNIGCYFCEEYICEMGNNAYDVACKYGHLDIMKYLDKKWNDIDGHHDLDDYTYKLLTKHAENKGRMNIVHYLRRRKYKRKFTEISSKNDECCICLETFKKSDIYCICKNGHSVHDECYINNLVITDKDQCVTCKGVMLKYKIKC